MMNNVTIIGRLTATPELRETSDGTKVASILVAVDRDRKNEDGTRTSDFISVTAWRGNAEFICKNFDKGDYIAISGSLRSRIRDGENDKTYRQLDVVADRINFCGYRRPKEQ